MGGCEIGFMSTTSDGAVARQYCKKGVILEIQPGMVDRGASMKDFSQYPHEVEVTWPPLTALSYVSKEVDGAVVKLQVQPTICQQDGRRLAAPPPDAIDLGTGVAQWRSGPDG